MLTFMTTMPSLVAAFTPFFALMPIIMLQMTRQNSSVVWITIPICLIVVGIIGMILAAKKEFLVFMTADAIRIGKKEYKRENIVKVKVHRKTRYFYVYMNRFPRSVAVHIKSQENISSIITGLETWSSKTAVPLEVI